MKHTFGDRTFSETMWNDPMGQGSLLAVFAYGGLAFRLRFAYSRDSYDFQIFQIPIQLKDATSEIGFESDLSKS